MQSLPLELIIDNVFPYLERNSFNSFSVASKDLLRVSKKVLPPWPERLYSRDHLPRTQCLAFSPDGTTIACGCSDSKIRLWDIRSGEYKPLDGHWPGEAVVSIVFSKSVKMLASSSTDHTIRIWHLDGEKPPRKIHASHVNSLDFLANDEILFSGHYNSETIKVWNVSSGSLVRTLSGNARGLVKDVLSETGNSLISTCNDGLIKRWNLSDGTNSESWNGGSYNAIGSSPKNRVLVASVRADDCFELWNTETSGRRTCAHSKPHRIEFSPNGDKLASIDIYRNIKVWATKDGSLLSELEDKSLFAFHEVRFSPDARTVGAISRHQNMIRLFQT